MYTYFGVVADLIFSWAGLKNPLWDELREIDVKYVGKRNY